MLVTIIIPVYNVEEQYLRACIDSARNQTYSNLEIILVDDGSTNNNPAVCDEYAAKDNRVRVVHQHNGGLSVARNTGISIMAGEYVTFLDADDYIPSTFIENLLKVAIDTNAKTVAATFMFSSDTTHSFEECQNHYEVLSFKEIMCRMFTQGDLQSACGKLFKADLFNDERFIPGRYQEDIAITYRLFYKAQRIACLDWKGYVYFQRQGSIMHSEYSLQKLSGYYSYKERVYFLREHGEIELFNRYMKQYLAIALSTYYKLKRFLPNCIGELAAVRKDIRQGSKYLLNDKNMSVVVKIGVFIGNIFPYTVGYVATLLTKEVGC